MCGDSLTAWLNFDERRGDVIRVLQAERREQRCRLRARAARHDHEELVALPFDLQLQVERQGNEFLVVVSGGPRPKSAALLAALRLKDAYHVAPTLVEVQPGR